MVVGWKNDDKDKLFQQIRFKRHEYYRKKHKVAIEVVSNFQKYTLTQSIIPSQS